MANIVLKYSTGSSSSTTANGQASSLGGKMGRNQSAVITTGSTISNNLFDDITKTQNANSAYDYRCFYIHNDTTDVTQTFTGGEIFLNNTPLTEIDFFVSDTKNVFADPIANDTVEPTGVSSWTSATSVSPLPLLASNNVLNAGDYIFFWVRRKATNTQGSGLITDSIHILIRGAE